MRVSPCAINSLFFFSANGADNPPGHLYPATLVLVESLHEMIINDKMIRMMWGFILIVLYGKVPITTQNKKTLLRKGF